jgi:lysozyme
MIRQASPAAKHLISRFEGTRLSPYVCPAGKWTVGVGHRLYSKDVVSGLHFDGHKWIGTITQDTCDRLLLADMTIAGNAVNELVKVPLTQNQFDALVSFVLNVGRDAFNGSTLLRELNQKHYLTAAQELPRWCHDDHGNILRGLLTRRETEQDLFNKN